ncbi:hypothetical protein BDR05DRAFT_1006885 [Suillus weaverae]|nr:hypothetical protein BDR05DRAFT_1006885 [Suillus weaverae]
MFFSEFHRTCESSRLTYALLQMPKESLPCEVAEHMLKASAEERGTVAALAALSKELDEANTDAGQIYALSPHRQKTSMTLETCRLLAQSICFRSPLTPVHCRSDRPVVAHSIPLNCEVMFFDYVVLKGKRYYASRTVGHNSSSLVHAVIPNLHGKGSRDAYGELLEVFQFEQDILFAGQLMWFGHMRWFRPWHGSSACWEDL